jgi:hypothetical protein
VSTRDAAARLVTLPPFLAYDSVPELTAVIGVMAP